MKKALQLADGHAGLFAQLLHLDHVPVMHRGLHYAVRQFREGIAIRQTGEQGGFRLTGHVRYFFGIQDGVQPCFRFGAEDFRRGHGQSGQPGYVFPPERIKTAGPESHSEHPAAAAQHAHERSLRNAMDERFSAVFVLFEGQMHVRKRQDRLGVGRAGRQLVAYGPIVFDERSEAGARFKAEQRKLVQSRGRVHDAAG